MGFVFEEPTTKTMAPPSKGRFVFEEEAIPSIKRPSGASRSFAPTAKDSLLQTMEEQYIAPFEAVGSLATGIAEFPLARLGKVVDRFRGKSEEEALATEQRMSEKWTYQPQTKTAQEILEPISKVTDFLATTGREAFSMPVESWGLEGGLKELALTAGELAAFGTLGKIGKGIKGIKKLRDIRALPKPTPIEEVKVGKPRTTAEVKSDSKYVFEEPTPKNMTEKAWDLGRETTPETIDKLRQDWKESQEKVLKLSDEVEANRTPETLQALTDEGMREQVLSEAIKEYDATKPLAGEGVRTTVDVVSDVKTVLGDIGKAKGLTIEDVSPESIARQAERTKLKAEARDRLVEDAKRLGKGVDEYLASHGVTPEDIAKFMAEMPKKKTPEAKPTKEYEATKLGKRTELASIEHGLTKEGFGDLTGYEKTPGFMADQAKKAQAIMDSDWDSSVKMAMGDAKTPTGVLPETMYKAVEKRAIQNNDLDTLYKLATESKIATEASVMGQRIKALDSGIVNSPVDVAMEVSKERLETSRRTGRKPLSPRRLEDLSKKIETVEKDIVDHEVSKAVRKARLDVAKEQRQAKRTVTSGDLDVEFRDLAKELNSILSGQLNVGLDPAAVKVLTEMTLNRIKKGIIKAENIVDAIYTEARKVGVDINKRDIQDAISQYGKTKHMSQEDLKVKLREAKTNIRLISALEDATEGKAPLKTGLQRDVMSEEVRLRTKAVKDMMREKGIITIKTPEEQWKTALASYKTRLTNEIAEMERNIAKGKFVKKRKTTTVLDTKAQQLKARRDSMKKMYDTGIEVSGKVTKKELTTLVDLYNTSERLKVEMEQGGNRYKYGASKVAYENYIEALKGKNDPLIQIIKERKGEFKTTFEENPARAVTDVIKDTLRTITDNSIAMVASLDNSFLGRQGLTTLLNDLRNKVLFRHRKSVWLDATKNSFIDFGKTIGGKKSMHDALMADVYSRPNYLSGEYVNAGIIHLVEEQFPTTLPRRIPLGIGRVFTASEYAFTGSALRMRTGLYDMFSSMAKEKGKPWGKVEQADMGKVINSMTARGKWGKRGENPLIRMILWAPKMLKADIDVLTMHMGGANLETSFARRQAALNLVTVIAEIAIVQAVVNAFFPGSAEIDPRSTNFGKIRIKNTGYATDLLGVIADGLGISSNRIAKYRTFSYAGSKATLITLAARLIMGATKNPVTGKVTEYSNKYGKNNAFDALIGFLTNKTTPGARTVIDKLRDQFFDLTPFTWGKAAQKIITPISIQNMIEMDKRKDVKKATKRKDY